MFERCSGLGFTLSHAEDTAHATENKPTAKSHAGGSRRSGIRQPQHLTVTTCDDILIDDTWRASGDRPRDRGTGVAKAYRFTFTTDVRVYFRRLDGCWLNLGVETFE